MPYPNQQRGRLFGNMRDSVAGPAQSNMDSYQTPASMPPPVSMSQQVMRPISPDPMQGIPQIQSSMMNQMPQMQGQQMPQNSMNPGYQGYPLNKKQIRY